MNGLDYRDVLCLMVAQSFDLTKPVPIDALESAIERADLMAVAVYEHCRVQESRVRYQGIAGLAGA